MNSDDPIADLLRAARNIAVVGLSSKRSRPSFGVAAYLQQAGYRIIPVNPQEKEVLGEKSYASLEDILEPFDIVNIFRRSEHVPEIVESAIRIRARSAGFVGAGLSRPSDLAIPNRLDDAALSRSITPRAIWMQEGVIHAGAAERALGAGLVVFMDLCIAKEHSRLFRSSPS